MATVDEDLNQLERDVRALKIEYEQYFGGGRNRPPTDTEWRIELLIKRYSERGADLSYAQRFRFNNLASTYAKYREVWRKRMKQKEEGVVQRHYGAAAREIEAERARARHAAEPHVTLDQPSVAGRPAYVVSCSNPSVEEQKVKELYAALVTAKQKAGEIGESLSFENFASFVRAKTEQLRREKNAAEVEYAVETDGGKVRLKARVKS